MINGILLYFKYIGISIKSQMQYKASFIMIVIGHFLITIIEFVGIWVLFERFKSLNGWSFNEVAFMYGIINCSFALSEAWVRGFDVFDHVYIKPGNFDRILLRPRSIILQITGHELQLMRVGRFMQGLIIMIWAASNLNLYFGIDKIFLTVFAVLGGLFMFSGLFVIQATICFWSIQSLEIINCFTYGGVEMAQFPVEIYKRWFRNIFIFVIPTACINYFPGTVILNRQNYFNLPAVLCGLSPLVCIVFFILTLQFVKLGTRHYRSTGS